MCGLVGIIGNKEITKPMMNVFMEMVEVNSLRGRHSTGVLRLDKKGMRFYKKAVNGPVYVNSKDGFEFVTSGTKTRVLMGHNRWATKGEVNHANAHPFRHEHITLMHNGTLKGQYLLPDSARFPCDSENIAYSMMKLGEKETLEKLDGAYALVWHNNNDNTINFARNRERPLHFVVTGLGNIIYASEYKMLEWICDRNNVAIKEHIELPVGQHLKLKVGKDMKWDDVKTIPFQEYSAFRFNNNRSYGYNGWNQDDDYQYGGIGAERRAFLKDHPYGTDVEVYIYSFRPYRHNKYKGVGVGYVMEDPYFQVELNGFDSDTPLGTYEATVSSVRTDYNTKGKACIVVVSSSYTLEEAEDDPEQHNQMKEIVEEVIEDKGKDASSGGDTDSKVVYLPKTDSEGKYEVPGEVGLSLLAQLLRQLSQPGVEAVLKDYGCRYLRDVDPVVYRAVYVRALRERDAEDMDKLKEETHSKEECPLAMVPGPNKKLLTAAEFNKLTKHGCTNCGGNLELEDAPHIFWGEQNSVYCPTCVKEFFEMSAEPLH